MQEELILNDRIRARTVRLIAPDGHSSVVPYSEALSNARRQGLDLMLVAAGDLPVCRILDAGRFRFERKKNEREQAKRQRAMTIDTKEIQLRPVTDQNDLLIKVKRAKSFLEEGDKVKVVVRFRGRERYHRDYGRRMIERFMAEIGDHRIDRPMTDGDYDLSIVLGSITSKADIIKQRERQ